MDNLIKAFAWIMMAIAVTILAIVTLICYRSVKNFHRNVDFILEHGSPEEIASTEGYIREMDASADKQLIFRMATRLTHSWAIASIAGNIHARSV